MLSARTRPLSRGRAFRVGFRKPNARNGTQPEPRLRIILFTFETRRSVGERNSWKISSFRKLEIKPINYSFILVNAALQKISIFENATLVRKSRAVSASHFNIPLQYARHTAG